MIYWNLFGNTLIISIRTVFKPALKINYTANSDSMYCYCKSKILKIVLMLSVVCIRVSSRNTTDFTATGRFVRRLVGYDACWYWKIFLAVNWFGKKAKKTIYLLKLISPWTKWTKRWFLQSLNVPLRRTITSSHVAEVRQTEETPVSDSHWSITSNHWALTSQSKNHSYWTSIAFYTTILSVNSTNHAAIWDSLPTASCQVCGCVSDVSLRTSIPSGKDCCENEKRENATTWTINKSGRIMGPTVVATTDTSHKWKNSSALSNSMTGRIKTVPLTSSERSSVADVSRTPQLLLIKNQADTIRVRRYGFVTKGFLFLSVTICTMFNR